MTTKHLLDPQLLPLLDLLPAFDISMQTLPALRDELEANQVELADADAAGVVREEIFVPSEGEHNVYCLLYKPAQTTAKALPVYLHFHGGGYVVGSARSVDADNIALCHALGIALLSVDYRLAPEFDAYYQLADAYAALAWLHDNAEAHNFDRARIAVGGESAGGGLAAVLAIHATTKSEYAICHQHLTYPMLDNLTGQAEHYGDPLVGEFVWTRASNAFGWQSFLGKQQAVAPYVPARQADFSAMPSTWIGTASLDLFRDENIKYAQQLLSAGVRTELIVYPGACHGFQLLPGTELRQKYLSDHNQALARALGVS